MTEDEQIESIESNFPMNSISEIYGNYIMDKEEKEEDDLLSDNGNVWI